MTTYERCLYEEHLEIAEKMDKNVRNRLNTLPDKRVADLIHKERTLLREIRKLIMLELELYSEKKGETK